MLIYLITHHFKGIQKAKTSSNNLLVQILQLMSKMLMLFFKFFQMNNASIFSRYFNNKFLYLKH